MNIKSDGINLENILMHTFGDQYYLDREIKKLPIEFHRPCINLTSRKVSKRKNLTKI